MNKTDLLALLETAKALETKCMAADGTFDLRAVTGNYRGDDERAFEHAFYVSRMVALKEYGIPYYGKSVDDMIAAVSAIEENAS